MGQAAAGYTIVGGRPERGRLAALWHHRGTLWSFTLRELTVRYRQALLGFAWALLQPLALTLAAALVFPHITSIDTGGMPYALFVLTALVPWTYFQASVMGAVPTLVSNANLVRKIWFPREALPLATVCAVGLDLLIGLALWLVWLAFAGGAIGSALLWLPLLITILVAFTASIALLGAALNVRFRDVKHALPVLLQVLLFASPILYSSSAVPEAWRTLYELNPLATVAEGLRDVALRGIAPDATRTLYGGLASLLLLVGAYRLYTRMDRRFADVV